MSNDILKLAGFYKALGHPVRLQILQKLLVCNSCFCKDLVKEFKWSQATISAHLKKLKNAGLISLHSRGAASEYSLSKKIKVHLFLHPSSFYAKHNNEKK